MAEREALSPVAVQFISELAPVKRLLPSYRNLGLGVNNSCPAVCILALSAFQPLMP